MPKDIFFSIKKMLQRANLHLQRKSTICSKCALKARWLEVSECKLSLLVC